jgi:hypothetical protein
MLFKANKIPTITSTLSLENNNNLKVCKITFSKGKLKKAANFEKNIYNSKLNCCLKS